MSWLSSAFRFNYVILSDIGANLVNIFGELVRSKATGDYTSCWLQLVPLSTPLTLGYETLEEGARATFHLAVIQTMWALVIRTTLSNPHNKFTF